MLVQSCISVATCTRPSSECSLFLHSLSYQGLDHALVTCVHEIFSTKHNSTTDNILYAQPWVLSLFCFSPAKFGRFRLLSVMAVVPLRLVDFAA